MCTKKRIISEVLDNARIEIGRRAGLEIRLSYFIESASDETSELVKLFEEVCSVWGVAISDLQARVKTAENVTMRHILWYLADNNFPCLNRAQAAQLLHRERTSVYHGINLARHFIETQDPLFMQFFQPVKHYLND